MGQVDLNPTPVGNVENIDNLLANLKKYKEEKNIPDGEWIFGWGYDDGQLADFVILDENPLSIEPMEIKNINILETIKEGESVFVRKNDK